MLSVCFFYVGDGAAIQYTLKPCGAEAVRNVFLVSFELPIDCGERYNIAQQQCDFEPVYCVKALVVLRELLRMCLLSLDLCRWVSSC